MRASLPESTGFQPVATLISALASQAVLGRVNSNRVVAPTIGRSGGYGYASLRRSTPKNQGVWAAGAVLNSGRGR
jgi:hypothetical protein